MTAVQFENYVLGSKCKNYVIQQCYREMWFFSWIKYTRLSSSVNINFEKL